MSHAIIDDVARILASPTPRRRALKMLGGSACTSGVFAALGVTRASAYFDDDKDKGCRAATAGATTPVVRIVAEVVREINIAARGSANRTFAHPVPNNAAGTGRVLRPRNVVVLERTRFALRVTASAAAGLPAMRAKPVAPARTAPTIARPPVDSAAATRPARRGRPAVPAPMDPDTASPPARPASNT